MRTTATPIVIFALLAAVAFPASPSGACTSFLLRHPAGPLMAKNYDWDVAAGLLIVNPRGLAKTAIVPDGVKPVRWTSRYGSLTFNQYGREFPLGGMNEAGLAIEVLWLAETVYPEIGDRRSIGALQWVQYCLDSFRTVGDVVASASEIAVTSTTPLHFLACDATANCAVIEFLDGRLVSRAERTLPLPVLTNNSFADSLDYLNRTLGYGGEPVTPDGPGSLPRFARTANGVFAARSAAGDRPVDDVFAILADVAQSGLTQWSIVYELGERVVHFATSANSSRRTVRLTDLDLDCTADPLMLDLLGPGAGDTTAALAPYSAEKNAATIDAGFSAKQVAAPPPEVVDALRAYPDGLVCTFAAAHPKSP